MRSSKSLPAWGLRATSAFGALAMLGAYGRYLPSGDVVTLLSIFAGASLAVRAGSLGIGTALSASLSAGTATHSGAARVWSARLILAATAAIILSVGIPALQLVGATALAAAWSTRDHLFSVIRAERDVYAELIAGPTLRLLELSSGLVGLLLGVRSPVMLVAIMAVTNVVLVLALAVRFAVIATLRPALPRVGALVSLARTGVPLFVSGATIAAMQLILEREYEATVDGGVALFVAGGLRGLDTFMAVGATLVLLRPFLQASRTQSRQRLRPTHAVMFSAGSMCAYLAGAFAATSTVGAPRWPVIAMVLVPLAYVPIWLWQAFRLHQDVASGSRPLVLWGRSLALTGAWVAVWVAVLENLR